MTIDVAAAAPIAVASPASGAAIGHVQAGYGVSLSDFGSFHQVLAQAGARLEARPVGTASEAVKVLSAPFDHINTEASQLSVDAQAAKADGGAMSPGDMVLLTARCQEFSFHCTLMSNIANRTSDGLQQMFKQQ
jgi:FlaG/FlaF family flagellin (archaellin)